MSLFEFLVAKTKSANMSALEKRHVKPEKRRNLFQSLEKIRRHLSRHDPGGLQRISEWYCNLGLVNGATSVTVGAAEEQPVEDEKRRLRRLWQRRRRLRRQRRWEARGQEINFQYFSRSGNNDSHADSCDSAGRIQQIEIDNAKLSYLPVPKGVAKRGLLVPPQPDWLFSDSLPELPPEAFQQDYNASNAEEAARRFLKREMTRKVLDKWVFLYFRILRVNWESIVVEEKKADPDINMYAEEHLHKWTVRLRFKVLRQVPIKVALYGFLSRLGLERDTMIVFCTDGFYGLMDVGNIYGDMKKTPCALISMNTTPRYLGLKNGDCVFVNSCSNPQRQMMEDAQHLSNSHRQRQFFTQSVNDGVKDDDNEEGELVYD